MILPYLLYVFGQTGLSNSVDSDQTPRNAASDQSLLCLPPTHLAILHTFTGSKMDLLKRSIRRMSQVYQIYPKFLMKMKFCVKRRGSREGSTELPNPSESASAFVLDIFLLAFHLERGYF